MPAPSALLPLLPLLAALPAVALPAVAQQEGAPQSATVDVVAIKDDRHDRLTVPVRIGAHGPFDFLIDTGAQNTVISTALAVPKIRARMPMCQI